MVLDTFIKLFSYSSLFFILYVNHYAHNEIIVQYFPISFFLHIIFCIYMLFEIFDVVYFYVIVLLWFNKILCT